MGDFYASLVMDKADAKDVPQLADKVVRHLIDKKIISPTKTDCVLGDKYGYPPADNFAQAVESADSNLLSLRTNGLQVVTDRQVFNANGVDQVKCPKCGAENIDSDWGQALEEWNNQTGKDKIKCSQCGADHAITDYIFEPTWAFRQLGFTFWNWGAEFKDKFVKDVETLTGQKIKIVYGKL